ncbi:MAG: acyl-CoA dehydratase activase-related protein, partial [Spirochaetes bacterium]|nr:acyl-CoA dehydratase activase-related protein [Spirochaetota bacterium]
QVFLGIDIGSTSTKAVLVDENQEVIAGLYGRTKGEPVKAVTNLFGVMKKLFANKDLVIKGVATTGSGRSLIKEIISADLAINEITAHATAATFLDPQVDTIIEIGGQDSKFTTLKEGAVLNATMNYVCAAGTGSFIEEQAKRLDITLDEISDMAMGETAPFTSDRCTVYMERDLNLLLSEGYSKEQIITSVLFSVRDNYLSKVVGKSPLGNKIYFQGATAKNKALVAVFENELNQPILVSRYCHLTGALGSALYLMEKNLSTTTFAGIDFQFEMESEVCTLCSNQCDLQIYSINDKKIAWGLKCGRDYEEQKVGSLSSLSELEKDFRRIMHIPSVKKSATKVIGIPQALYLVEYLPMFQNFFQKLGYQVIIEKGNDKNMKTGISIVQSEFCAPMILTHGLVKSLLDKKVDYIFLPAMISEQSLTKKLDDPEKILDKESDSFFCYYSEYAATITENLATIDLEKKLLSPKIKFNNRKPEAVAAEISEDLADVLALDKEEITSKFLEAYSEYQDSVSEWKKAGQQILNSNKDQMKILLLGRPYAVFDPRINLGIPKKIEEKGFSLLYQSMLELPYENDPNQLNYIDKMHWFYGQQIYLATKIVAEHPDVYPVFLSCFRCSPDAYLINYFKDVMEQINKPYLIIQLDEHSSDVGYQTRIEASIETFTTDFEVNKNQQRILKIPQYRNDPISQNDLVLIPYVSNIISDMQKIVYEAHGYQAMVMPLEQRMVNLGYRYASGGECMPNVAITGSVIETILRNKLDPAKTILYLPTTCLGCNFTQFSLLIDMAAQKAGIHGLKIANPSAMQQQPELSKKLNTDLLSANILGSILYKLYFRYHPYEKQAGMTEKAMAGATEIVRDYLAQGKTLSEAARKIRTLFEEIAISKERKPRIGILGDLYAKYNMILNNDIYGLIEELGGEVMIPSFTDTVSHLFDADIRENDLDKKYLKGLVIFEKSFERIFKGMLDDAFEPPHEECVELMHEFGIKHYIPGETTLNLGRTFYYMKHKLVDAIVNVNPMLCCPGVITASISRKIQKEYQIPIIDLFYDGTNKPNKIIIPHLYYLNKK